MSDPIAGEELEPILAEARAAGLVADWPDAPGGPAVMLSSLAADHLGIALVAPVGANILRPGGQKAFRWVGRGEITAERARSASRVRTKLPQADADPWMPGEVTASDVLTPGRDFDDIPDPRSPTAEAVTLAAEQAVSRLRGAKLDVVRQATLDGWRAILILGLRPAWPVAWTDGEPCPVCRGRKLSIAAYCALCHRTGIDHMLEDIPAPPPRTSPRRGDGLAGGVEAPVAQPRKPQVPRPTIKAPFLDAKIRPKRSRPDPLKGAIEAFKGTAKPTPPPVKPPGFSPELDALRAAKKAARKKK